VTYTPQTWVANTTVVSAARMNYIEAGITAAGGGAGDWDSTVTKASDQDITNNATPQNDTELFASLLANAAYLVEFVIFYSVSDNNGYRCRLSFPTLVDAFHVHGWTSYVEAGASLFFRNDKGTTIQWPSTDLQCISGPSQAQYMLHGRVNLVTQGSGTLQYQFANNAATSGRISRTEAGSILRIKKLA